MATANKQPFSLPKVNIYRRIFRNDAKQDAQLTAEVMFDTLRDDAEDINRRCAAILVIWYDLPGDPFKGDYEALYTFAVDIAHVCSLARRSTRCGFSVDEIRRIDETRDDVRETADEWREDAEFEAREFAPYRHYSMV